MQVLSRAIKCPPHPSLTKPRNSKYNLYFWIHLVIEYRIKLFEISIIPSNISSKALTVLFISNALFQLLHISASVLPSRYLRHCSLDLVKCPWGSVLEYLQPLTRTSDLPKMSNSISQKSYGIINLYLCPRYHRLNTAFHLSSFIFP